MAAVDFFSSFGYQWAQGATSYGWDDAQWKNGWLSIGSTPPSVGQFDAVQKITDLKLKYVFDAINSIATSGGLTLNSANASSLSSVLYRNATTTLRGMVILASAAEVQAGTEATKVVTPSTLNSRTATETRTGLVELATPTEVIAGTDATRAVTPAGLAAFSAAKNEKDPTETDRGMPLMATAAETLSGVAGKVVDPARLRGVTFNSAQVVYATSGVFTWAVPDILRLGVKKARIRGCGGGGGGARNVAASGGVSYGGGGGGAFEVIVDLTGVASVQVTIGAGGAGASSPTTASGSAGGTTSFGTYASATGGNGGITGGSGVAGGEGASSIPGALLHRGSSGQVSVTGSDGTARYGGQGGGSIFGPGGMSNSNAWTYGGGGGGSFGTVTAPGDGNSGVIVIDY